MEFSTITPYDNNMEARDELYAKEFARYKRICEIGDSETIESTTKFFRQKLEEGRIDDIITRIQVSAFASALGEGRVSHEVWKEAQPVLEQFPTWQDEAYHQVKVSRSTY